MREDAHQSRRKAPFTRSSVRKNLEGSEEEQHHLMLHDVDTFRTNAVEYVFVGTERRVHIYLHKARSLRTFIFLEGLDRLSFSNTAG